MGITRDEQPSYLEEEAILPALNATEKTIVEAAVKFRFVCRRCPLPHERDVNFISLSSA